MKAENGFSDIPPQNIKPPSVDNKKIRVKGNTPKHMNCKLKKNYA